MLPIQLDFSACRAGGLYPRQLRASVCFRRSCSHDAATLPSPESDVQLKEGAFSTKTTPAVDITRDLQILQEPLYLAL